MKPEVVEELRAEAVKHLIFVIGLYEIQFDGGRHFLHEQPQSATSWSDPRMQKLLNERKVSTTVSDQLTPGPDGSLARSRQCGHLVLRTSFRDCPQGVKVFMNIKALSEAEQKPLRITLWS